jgi:hypothetical protein
VKIADKVVYQFDASAFHVTIGYAEAEAGVMLQAFVSVVGTSLSFQLLTLLPLPPSHALFFCQWMDRYYA